jgi:hypothetical protein
MWRAKDSRAKASSEAVALRAAARLARYCSAAAAARGSDACRACMRRNRKRTREPAARHAQHDIVLVFERTTSSSRSRHAIRRGARRFESKGGDAAGCLRSSHARVSEGACASRASRVATRLLFRRSWVEQQRAFARDRHRRCSCTTHTAAAQRAS